MAAANPQSVTPASPMGNPNYTPASLYVGDLKPDVSEALLFDIFNNVGPVASIRVCRDVISRRSLGYAYVNFHSVQDAERAVDTMNFSVIRGHPCRIMWSQRDPSLRKSGVGNIFVKNLDRSIDHKTLYDTFSMFGNILSCKVATNEKGDSLGYGFVHYETIDSATKAIEKVNGMVIAGREVVVAPFKAKSQRDGGESAASFTNIYCKNLKSDMTEDSFRAMFEKFGPITSIALPTNEAGKPKGFGFVNFREPEHAAEAVAELHSEDENGLYCARAQKKEERERLLREKFESMRIQQAEKYAGVNLYIKNLADSVDDSALETEFKEFGTITSAKVMCDDNGRSKGFGFVCFTDKEEAAKAVSDMNGKVMAGKPLYVTLAQRKEVRRQQLEAQAQVNRTKMAAGLPPPQMYPSAPLFYQQPAGPGQMPRPAPGYMYPQQMMQQRWNPRQQTPQMLAAMGGPRPGQPMSNMYMSNLMQQQYQQAAMQQQAQQGGRGQPAPLRGSGRGNVGNQAGRQPVMKPTGQPGAMPSQQNRIKYENNVRNQSAAAQQQAQQAQPQAAAVHQAGAAVAANSQATNPPIAAEQQSAGGPPGPLTSQALARAPTQQQKQMIGERIFPLIEERQPMLAGKITGMLLEMDNTELLHLLENREALNAKIAEAMSVLQAHDEQQSGTASAPTEVPASASATASD